MAEDFHYAFASDNCAGICPEAWSAMQHANEGFLPPYGEDRWTARASELLREIFEYPCDVYFTFNGTAANSLALASMCRSFHSVIAHQSAHIETDECGGPEFFTHGTKLLLVEGEHGRVSLAAVDETVRRRSDIHFPKPRVLSITQSTEMGTIYTPDHLDQIHETCRRHQLKLHMDGARFANATASLGLAPKEITWKVGVDVLCLGGTKNGMAVGDCVVFFDRELSAEFAYRCKQAGQLASKMRYMAAPWVGLLTDGHWLRHARHANQWAKRLGDELSAIPGIDVVHPVEANAVFLKLPSRIATQLRTIGWHFYEFIGGGARFMCSWQTQPGHVEHLIQDLRNLTTAESEARAAS